MSHHQHFDQRARLGRLVRAIASEPRDLRLGFGIDENNDPAFWDAPTTLVDVNQPIVSQPALSIDNYLNKMRAYESSFIGDDSDNGWQTVLTFVADEEDKITAVVKGSDDKNMLVQVGTYSYDKESKINIHTVLVNFTGFEY